MTLYHSYVDVLVFLYHPCFVVWVSQVFCGLAFRCCAIKIVLSSWYLMCGAYVVSQMLCCLFIKDSLLVVLISQLLGDLVSQVFYCPGITVL